MYHWIFALVPNWRVPIFGFLGVLSSGHQSIILEWLVTIGNPGLQTLFLRGSHNEQLFEHMLPSATSFAKSLLHWHWPIYILQHCKLSYSMRTSTGKINVRGRYAWTWMFDLQRLIIWTGHFESNHRTTTWFVYLCSRSPVPRTSRSGMVPFRRKKNTTLPLHPICSIWEPDTSYNTYVLPVYDLRAIYIIIMCIYIYIDI